jgi:hypothetical protein
LSLPSAYNTEGVDKATASWLLSPKIDWEDALYEAGCVFCCLRVYANFVIITNTSTAVAPWLPSVYYSEGTHEVTAMEMFVFV